MLVTNENFKTLIPNLNPLSREYKIWWKNEKRKCIEGYWSSGKWMPGLIYFYINFWKIQLNLSNTAKQKVIGDPFLRDLEWEKGYVFTEARGFSGFQDDDIYTCHKILEKNTSSEEVINVLYPRSNPDYQEIYNNKGELKKFEPARTYLRRNHGKDLGKPLYKNQARNIVDLECRGGGKSFLAACVAGLNFLFDGALDYDDYLLQQSLGSPYSSETMIGAIDSKYSNDLLSKFKIGLDNLKGAQERGNKFYPSPFSKKYDGSLMCGKFITAKYKVKRGANWDVKGSSSKLYHRSFADNPEAGNGTRSNVILLEEVGFMGNLEEALGSLKATTYNGAYKTGTIWLFGTGGKMATGQSEGLKRIFYDPEGYDCLSFEDTYENTGKIGFFVPYQYALNSFKDEEGNTDIEKANTLIAEIREKLRKGKSKEPLDNEKQNNPIVPSEAFMITDGNIFPTVELKEQLNYLESITDDSVEGDKGELTIGSDGRVKWLPDLDNKFRPSDYPVKKGEATAGCIVIWEHPEYIDGAIPYGLYIAGNDPYDQDEAKNSESLGSTFIYKSFMTSDGIHDVIVAEYTGRPSTAKEHHETVRRLLLYYNATCLYENEKNTIKMHFEHNNSLYLLANTPGILKANQGSSLNRTYGQHMTDHVKDELEIYTRDWLSENRGDGKLNLHTIKSKPLLKELISYSRNKELNYDRVIAFMLVILLKLQNHRIKIESLKEGPKIDPFFERTWKLAQKRNINI